MITYLLKSLSIENMILKLGYNDCIENQRGNNFDNVYPTVYHKMDMIFGNVKYGIFSQKLRNT